MDQIIATSEYQDSIFHGGQGTQNAYQHAMSAPGQPIEQAKAQFDDFLETNLKSAINLERLGAHAVSIEFLGKSLHAISDSTSPSHKGFQVWDPSRGIAYIQEHRRKEATITTQERDDTAVLMRREYERFKRRFESGEGIRINLIGSSGFSSVASELISFSAFTGL